MAEGPHLRGMAPQPMTTIIVSDIDSGGGERDRTDDLLVANQALSQLSYTPDLPPKYRAPNRFTPNSTLKHSAHDLVGLGRFELPTSRLSGVRSNRLSYRPFLSVIAFR